MRVSLQGCLSQSSYCCPREMGGWSEFRYPDLELNLYTNIPRFGPDHCVRRAQRQVRLECRCHASLRAPTGTCEFESQSQTKKKSRALRLQKLQLPVPYC